MTNRKLRREVAMPLLAANPVIVEPAQREALEALLRAHSTSQQLALRIRIILQAADDVGVRESARELDVWPKTVRYWRGRVSGRSAIGASAKLPMKRYDAAWFRTSRSARWGV